MARLDRFGIFAEEAIKGGNNKEGERILKSILCNESSSTDDAFLKEQEASLLRLGELYGDTKDANALAETVCSSRTFMSNIAKAKTVKLVRTLIDYFEDIPDSRQTQIQNLETKLIGLYYDNKNYREALPLIDALLKELKKLDDKMILTEVHLLESKVKQPVREVETKLSQLILDRRLHGILSQDEGCLVVYDQPVEDKSYQLTLDTLKHVGTVVDSLYKKANKLT
ncbi:related to 26S proteasome non-atpase regulatory subunit Rpn6 [Ustilago bromivora]|uniref:Related to 26S proteasome non-atpase regulatory subunit Rpn6 n=1 Tax=Ustilago bromivora TaxID=307758 RepID=A0A1K0GW89_9BASI|nr:related to 26S proteasome non-atpase regulatory subunit Rpn6 [Ustilago bromivora]SYW86280.1 related to 26S proteasome non-atpase regulatory subunit Rpn6 [Ustilago bromivora]